MVVNKQEKSSKLFIASICVNLLINSHNAFLPIIIGFYLLFLKGYEIIKIS